jgi:hypothetical protein
MVWSEEILSSLPRKVLEKESEEKNGWGITLLPG